MAENRQELAQERTEWATSRTELANERTFSAWIRTGLAALATGYVIAKLASKFRPRWIILGLGIGLCMVAAGVILMGLVTYLRQEKTLPDESRRRGTRIAIATVSVGLALISVAAGIFLAFE